MNSAKLAGAFARDYDKSTGGEVNENMIRFEDVSISPREKATEWIRLEGAEPVQTFETEPNENGWRVVGAVYDTKDMIASINEETRSIAHFAMWSGDIPRPSFWLHPIRWAKWKPYKPPTADEMNDKITILAAFAEGRGFEFTNESTP